MPYTLSLHVAKVGETFARAVLAAEFQLRPHRRAASGLALKGFPRFKVRYKAGRGGGVLPCVALEEGGGF